jgi:hypothetical protein
LTIDNEKNSIQNPVNFETLYQSFKQSILHGSKAQEYCKQRNLDIVKLGIGYNPEKKFPHLKNCLIFPLRNKENEIVSFYGRSILNNENAKHFYLKDRTGLYPNYPKPETEILILTESIIDAATLIDNGKLTIDNEKTSVLACYGTNGLTPEHLTAISELSNLKEIVIFFDGDGPGREGIKMNSEKLMLRLSSAQETINENVKISYVETPENEDINSLSQGHEPEIFTHLIENRKQWTIDNGELIMKEKEPEKNNYPLSIVNYQLNTSNPDYITFTNRELQFTLLGGINLQQLDRMRVTLKISTSTHHQINTLRHNLDLYNEEQLTKFIEKVSEKLETSSHQLNKAVEELTERLENYRMSKMESRKEQKIKRRELTEERKRTAIEYLKTSNLLQKTNEDIGKTGIVGEENNRLLMYLIFISRLREQPLHIISLGSSGVGKTYLQEKISELIPEHDKLEITILSENAFYYFEQKELKHKLVLIEDMDGAENVLYPLRELQSKKRISKTIPIKDNKGNLKTITLQVEGPICLAGTTTKEKLYEDNANRSLLIYLDTSKEQQERVMEYQRKLSAGKINTKQETAVKELFKDIQTVLKPITVRNPFAEQLKIPDYVFKPLRTNTHYLSFIETVTFYNQYQREIKTDKSTGENFIETTIEDIENANELMKDVLLAKSDELNQVLRNFFETLKYHLKSVGKETFYSKELRERLRMNPMTTNRYLRDLESRSFIKRTGGNRKSGFEYEIANKEEYSELQANMNVLDEILETIRTKYNMSITSRNVILN